jgi:hypothetical protein
LDMKEVRKHQTGWAGSDDSDLGPDGAQPQISRAVSTTSRSLAH